MYSIEEFKLLEPKLKSILDNSQNQNILANLDWTISDEPVYNFTMASKQELDILENEIKSKIPGFQIKRMPYSPWFLLISGIQRD